MRHNLKEEFEKYSLYILDCDGVVWKGDQPIKSAIESVNWLRKMNKKVVFLTNNSSLSREKYVKKFEKMGLKVSINEIYTSSYATALYLKNRNINNVFVIGEDGIYIELKERDINTSLNENVNAVIVGIDREINYWKIAFACKLLRNNNVMFIVTNPDPTVPSPYGELPGAGSIISSIAACSKRKPDINIGKPSKEIFNLVLQEHNVDPQKVLVIGDRIETDILGAKNAGLDSALVLTGVTKVLDKKDIQPTYILKTLYDMFQF